MDCGSTQRASMEYLGVSIATRGWVLPPLCNSWIRIIHIHIYIWLYITLKKTLNIDCYRVGAVDLRADPASCGLGFCGFQLSGGVKVQLRIQDLRVTI